MQTWLPYKDFAASARALRNKELGRQRVDAKMVINALVFPERNSKWRFHPVCRMWKGYETHLIDYWRAVVCEWKMRGRKHTMTLDLEINTKIFPASVAEPWWLGCPEFHESQQAALIRRCPEFYSRLFPDVPDFPPIWPVSRNGERNKFLVKRELSVRYFSQGNIITTDGVDFF